MENTIRIYGKTYEVIEKESFLYGEKDTKRNQIKEKYLIKDEDGNRFRIFKMKDESWSFLMPESAQEKKPRRRQKKGEDTGQKNLF